MSCHRKTNLPFAVGLLLAAGLATTATSATSMPPDLGLSAQQLGQLEEIAKEARDRIRAIEGRNPRGWVSRESQAEIDSIFRNLQVQRSKVLTPRQRLLDLEHQTQRAREHLRDLERVQSTLPEGYGGTRDRLRREMQRTQERIEGLGGEVERTRMGIQMGERTRTSTGPIRRPDAQATPPAGDDIRRRPTRSTPAAGPSSSGQGPAPTGDGIRSRPTRSTRATGGSGNNSGSSEGGSGTSSNGNSGNRPTGPGSSGTGGRGASSGPSRSGGAPSSGGLGMRSSVARVVNTDDVRKRWERYAQEDERIDQARSQLRAQREAANEELQGLHPHLYSIDNFSNLSDGQRELIDNLKRNRPDLANEIDDLLGEVQRHDRNEARLNNAAGRLHTTRGAQLGADMLPGMVLGNSAVMLPRAELGEDRIFEEMAPLLREYGAEPEQGGSAPRGAMPVGSSAPTGLSPAPPPPMSEQERELHRLVAAQPPGTFPDSWTNEERVNYVLANRGMRRSDLEGLDRPAEARTSAPERPTSPPGESPPYLSVPAAGTGTERDIQRPTIQGPQNPVHPPAGTTTAQDRYRQQQQAYQQWLRQRNAYQQWLANRQAYDRWLAQQSTQQRNSQDWLGRQQQHRRWQAYQQAYRQWLNQQQQHRRWLDYQRAHRQWQARQRARQQQLAQQRAAQQHAARQQASQLAQRAAQQGSRRGQPATRTPSHGPSRSLGIVPDAETARRQAARRR